MTIIILFYQNWLVALDIPLSNINNFFEHINALFYRLTVKCPKQVVVHIYRSARVGSRCVVYAAPTNNLGGINGHIVTFVLSYSLYECGCACLSYTRWLPDFARVPYYAPSPRHMHTVINCHQIKSLRPPVKQYTTIHNTTHYFSFLIPKSQGQGPRYG